MNRRDFGMTIGGLLASWFITPAKRRVDLSAFCHDEPTRYDMTRPFHQDDFTYATDGKVCVRVRPEFGDLRDNGSVKLPPAKILPWRHDELAGWRSLRAFQPLRVNECPECHGLGRIWQRRAGTSWCEGCGSTEWSGIACDRCGDKRPCGHCNGRKRLVTTYRHGELFMGTKQVERLGTLGDVEWTVQGWQGIDGKDTKEPYIIAFRFDGGDGLQLPLHAERAKTLNGLTA